MDMTRRRIVAVGAALPLVGVAVPQVIAATVPATPPDASVYPVGWLVDTFETAPDPRYHTAIAPTIAVHVRMIWDGERLVRLDSMEGTAVLNRLLQGRV